MSCRFRNKRRYRSNIANFSNDRVLCAPLTGFPLELDIGAGDPKTTVLGLPGGDRILTIFTAVWNCIHVRKLLCLETPTWSVCYGPVYVQHWRSFEACLCSVKVTLKLSAWMSESELSWSTSGKATYRDVWMSWTTVATTTECVLFAL